jgi:superfamily II DNA/RNA helicase
VLLINFALCSRFDSFNLSPATIKALHQDLGYEKMTVVQEATLPACLDGKDVLAKAKTGTGKTLGFLVRIESRVSGYHNAIGDFDCALRIFLGLVLEAE